jgi:hypothetical protein
MKHRHSTKTGELKRLAMAAVVVASFLVPQASAAACSSGQVCHYTAFDYDTTWAHMRHYGNNDRWAVQFPELVLNDWSIRNLGTTGMAVETLTGIWGFGSRAYCINNYRKANLFASGGDGESHFWISGSSSCL